MNTTTLLSFGYLVSRIQQSPFAIEAALSGIPPAYIIDGVSYWTPEAERVVDEQIRTRRAEAILGRKIPSEVKP